MKEYSYLRDLRLEEIKKAQGFFPNSGRILEIGAGAGWQLQYFFQKGYSVFGVDLKTSNYRELRVTEIVDYDGEKLPFSENSFDIIFSSHVLEHVERLDGLMSEVSRVLKYEGYLISVVPSSTWRIWTSLSYPAYILKRLTALRSPKDIQEITLGQSRDHRNSGATILRFFPKKHGVRGNLFSEIHYFSSIFWVKKLRSYGLIEGKTKPLGIFYTGYSILGSKLNFNIRGLISKIFGSSSSVMVFRNSRKK